MVPPEVHLTRWPQGEVAAIPVSAGRAHPGLATLAAAGLLPRGSRARDESSA